MSICDEKRRPLFLYQLLNSNKHKTKGAASAKYWVPATNTRVVGSQVERLIDQLIRAGLNTAADFHLSGYFLLILKNFYNCFENFVF